MTATACVRASQDAPKASIACEPGYRIMAQHPHDASHFTQGLAIVEGDLFESTGGYGGSAVYRKELRGGRVLREARLPDEIFGEGLAHVAGEIVVLSWREGAGFVYGLSLSPRRVFRYPGEGWGLTTQPAPSGLRLLMSDGSDTLRVLRPTDFTEVGHIAVRENGAPLRLLNELEFVDGLIYANVWTQDRVVLIDPLSGEVRQSIDLSGLREHFTSPPGWQPAENVLNGIAHDPASGHFFLTGKRWPLLFEVQLRTCIDGIGN